MTSIFCEQIHIQQLLEVQGNTTLLFTLNTHRGKGQCFSNLFTSLQQKRETDKQSV